MCIANSSIGLKMEHRFERQQFETVFYSKKYKIKVQHGRFVKGLRYQFSTRSFPYFGYLPIEVEPVNCQEITTTLQHSIDSGVIEEIS